MGSKTSRWALALTLVFSACAHEGSASVARIEKEPVASSTPPPAPAAEVAAPAPTNCVSDYECSSSELCVASQCKPIAPDTPECIATATHFGFDQYTLQDADLPALQRAARCLSAARALRLKVEGYADERGTEAYNIALGQRRAAAVQDYLVTLGASAAQVDTVSYGKERPVCTEHTEACWAQNRRAQVERGL
jgi:peptidoglycan-associated lipoprotein